MNTNIAAALGAATVIAAAILFTNHWEIIQGTSSAGSAGVAVTMRLDRWTGSITLCEVDRISLGERTGFAGAQVVCKGGLQIKASAAADPLQGMQ
jgi:hypothetical protein